MWNVWVLVNWLRRLAVDTTPLQVPAFKRLFLGTVVTVIGTQMTLVAVPVQAYLLTGSSLFVGLTSIVALVPLVIFGLLGGAIANAIDRRVLLLITSAGAALTAVGLFLQSLLPGGGSLLLLWILCCQPVSRGTRRPVTPPSRCCEPVSPERGNDDRDDHHGQDDEQSAADHRGRDRHRSGHAPARRSPRRGPPATTTMTKAPGHSRRPPLGSGHMLEFDGLRKSYGSNLVLDGVSFAVEPGQMYGFCGSNGAGKTTTMRIALGLARADAGEVRWRERAVDLEVRRRIGYMPEERGLYPKMAVAEQLEYFGRLHGMNAAAAEESAGELLDGMGLADRSKDPLEKLSLGNQQRVQLAAALVSNPDVLILDEPFSGLDPTGVDALAANLAERRSRGVPVLFSSHQLDLVERLCDAVGILAGGKIVASGTVDQLRAGEANRQLRVVIPGSDGHWARELQFVTVDSDRDGEVLLQLDDPSRDQDVLAAAMAAGPVAQFGWRQPTLVEIFRETVTA